MSSQLPKFDDLPNKARYWKWGPPGSVEEAKGMLNLLTEDVVKEAAKEIKTGERTCIGWEFGKMEHPPFKRIRGSVSIKYVNPPTSLDDEYHFNPQSSSQWDGFRHFAQPIRMNDDNSLATQDEESQLDINDRVVWYGGTTNQEIFDPKNDRISIHHWAKEGIVSRGVFIDYKLWTEKQGINYSCFSTYEITLKDIQQIAKENNIEFRTGDILFIRTGMIKEWEGWTETQKIKYSTEGPWQHAGLEATEEMLRFLWDNQFAAVASDSIGFEVYPCKNNKFRLHAHLLAGWGMPIGEIFDLEKLSEICERTKRYTFFFSSVPFNAVGGVSSAPNGVAIF